MPKYAYFNPSANPSSVLGWFDTDHGEFPNLPPSDYLLTLTDVQWAQRGSGWQVQDRTLAAVPGISLADAKTAQLASVSASYAQAIQSDVSYMGTIFQADTNSQALLGLTLGNLNAIGATPPGFAWWDKNNNPVPMSLPQLQGLANAMWVAGFSMFVRKQSRKSAIRSASIETVQSIVF